MVHHVCACVQRGQDRGGELWEQSHRELLDGVLGPDPHMGNDTGPLEEILNSKPSLLPGGVGRAVVLCATV